VITTKSKTDQLKNLILQDIRSEVYRPGDSLPSILHLCERYGVSKHTVSQALSNLNELGIIELTHGKVTKIAANPYRRQIELVYVSDTPIEQQEFWAEFYRGIVDKFRQNPLFNFTLRSLAAHDSLGPLEHIDPAATAGALVLGSTNEQKLGLLLRYQIPFICVYEWAERPDISFVSADLKNSFEKLAQMFLARGCRRVVYIGPINPDRIDRGINLDKPACFRAALTEAGLSPADFAEYDSGYTLQDGYNTMKKILTEGPRPDGVFLFSDAIAPGVYRAMTEAGLRIGIDIAVAGCDNLAIGRFLTPSLTTIELNRYNQGKLAAQKIIERIENGTTEEIRDLLPTEVVERESLSLNIS